MVLRNTARNSPPDSKSDLLRVHPHILHPYHRRLVSRAEGHS